MLCTVQLCCWAVLCQQLQLQQQASSAHTPARATCVVRLEKLELKIVENLSFVDDASDFASSNPSPSSL